MRQWAQWHCGLNDSMHSACRYRPHLYKHTRTRTCTQREKSEKTENALGKLWAEREEDSKTEILSCCRVFTVPVLINNLLMCCFSTLLMLWNHQRAEEEWREKTEKEISRAAAEHVAQFNQYFLVIVGISLRNKPCLINHMENHSQTLTETSERSSY